MNKRTVAIAVVLELDVADEVAEHTLHRLVDKAMDNGIDGGFDASLGVTVTSKQVDIQL